MIETNKNFTMIFRMCTQVETKWIKYNFERELFREPDVGSQHPHMVLLLILVSIRAEMNVNNARFCRFFVYQPNPISPPLPCPRVWLRLRLLFSRLVFMNTVLVIFEACK